MCFLLDFFGWMVCLDDKPLKDWAVGETRDHHIICKMGQRTNKKIHDKLFSVVFKTKGKKRKAKKFFLSQKGVPPIFSGHQKGRVFFFLSVVVLDVLLFSIVFLTVHVFQPSFLLPSNLQEWHPTSFCFREIVDETKFSGQQQTSQSVFFFWWTGLPPLLLPLKTRNQD